MTISDRMCARTWESRGSTGTGTPRRSRTVLCTEPTRECGRAPNDGLQVTTRVGRLEVTLTEAVLAEVGRQKPRQRESVYGGNLGGVLNQPLALRPVGPARPVKVGQNPTQSIGNVIQRRDRFPRFSIGLLKEG